MNLQQGSLEHQTSSTYVYDWTGEKLSLSSKSLCILTLCLNLFIKILAFRVSTSNIGFKNSNEAENKLQVSAKSLFFPQQ